MSAREELAELLHARKFPYGGRADGFIWIDANAAYAIADFIVTAGYRQVFDGDCGLGGIADPTDREAAEAWMRWANLAMNDEIGAIGAMRQMLTEFGYRKPEAAK